jgi:pilus assembly protein Flp/PilA
LEEAMRGVIASVKSLLADERGTETLEWGLVCGLIVVGAIAAITVIGPKVQKMWNDVSKEIPPAS